MRAEHSEVNLEEGLLGRRTQATGQDYREGLYAGFYHQRAEYSEVSLGETVGEGEGTGRRKSSLGLG